MASGAALKKRKFVLKLQKYGTDITRRAKTSMNVSTTTTRTAATFKALLVADSERKVYVYNDFGSDNKADSSPYTVLCSPDVDVTWGDQLQFLGYIWRVVEKEIFPLDGVNIYMQLRAVRERPV